MHSANVFFPGKNIILSTYHTPGVPGGGNTAARIPVWSLPPGWGAEGLFHHGLWKMLSGGSTELCLRGVMMLGKTLLGKR